MPRQARLLYTLQMHLGKFFSFAVHFATASVDDTKPVSLNCCAVRRAQGSDIRYSLILI